MTHSFQGVPKTVIVLKLIDASQQRHFVELPEHSPTTESIHG